MCIHCQQGELEHDVAATMIAAHNASVRRFGVNNGQEWVHPYLTAAALVCMFGGLIASSITDVFAVWFGTIGSLMGSQYILYKTGHAQS